MVLPVGKDPSYYFSNVVVELVRKPGTMANRRTYFTYILTNNNRRQYIGMTNDLNRRLEEHRTGTKGFASAYKMTKLVYYEAFEGPSAALHRERIESKVESLNV